MGCVPNMGIERANDEDHRNGLKLVIGDKKNMSKLRLNLFIVTGQEIFNSLPTDLRTQSGSMETYKKLLDEFLTLIPDITRLEGPSGYTFNNLDSRVINWTWSLNIGL